MIVEPPWWRTWWFQSLAVVAGFGLVWLGYRQLRDRNLRRHNRVLQSEIAERRRVEEERAKLITKLESKNTELERFSHTVSHDLKLPLVTIKGFLGFLRKDMAAGDTERVRRDIDRIDKATGKMARLVDDLLELSTAGRVVTSLETVALSSLAEEAVELLGGEIEERGVRVSVTPQMPSALGDRGRLLQVYQNLIANAVKYMGEQQSPRVEIDAGTEDGRVVCYVRDNGIGIEAQDQAEIFKWFRQLDPEPDGSGIGLALVHSIVKAHGGELWVESAGKGHGSTFYFALPLAGADESSARA